MSQHDSQKQSAKKADSPAQTALALKIYASRISSLTVMDRKDCEKETAEHRMVQFRYIAERSLEAAQAFYESVPA